MPEKLTVKLFVNFETCNMKLGKSVSEFHNEKIKTVKFKHTKLKLMIHANVKEITFITDNFH